MAKYDKYHENTDAEETVFFQAAKDGKKTDQYDTQQLNAQQIRRRASQQPVYRPPYEEQETDIYTQEGKPDGYPQNGYFQNDYPQNSYPRNDYPHSGYPQNGYSQSGYPRNGYPQNSYRQNSSYPNVSGRTALNRQSQRYTTPNRQAAYSSESARRSRNDASHQRSKQPPNRTSPPRQSQSYGQAPRQRDTGYEASTRRRTAPESRASSRQTQKRPRKPSLIYRLIRTICLLIIALFLLYSAVALVGILSMNRVETSARSVTSGSLNASYVKNVLVIGTDSRDPEEDRGRSDSMILVSMNSKTGDCYMTSFMRDSYVEIPGNGSGKLNAAYSYGGAELLMDTIEYNFDVHIDDYVMFTFAACADAIDAVGGVELEISDEEAQAINEILISEVNEIMGDNREDDLLDGGGTLMLNGKQALSYSRIRYVGNADFERTERQRVVMQKVMEKALGNPFRLAALCMRALPDMTTNMSVLSLYSYAIVTPVQLLFYEMQQQRIPDDTMYQGADIGGESVLQVDFQAARQLLAETVYAE